MELKQQNFVQTLNSKSFEINKSDWNSWNSFHIALRLFYNSISTRTSLPFSRPTLHPTTRTQINASQRNQTYRRRLREWAWESLFLNSISMWIKWIVLLVCLSVGRSVFVDVVVAVVIFVLLLLLLLQSISTSPSALASLLQQLVCWWLISCLIPFLIWIVIVVVHATASFLCGIEVFLFD